MNADRARLIAYVAHGAIGQKRADGKTPYFTHPERVCELVTQFTEIYFYNPSMVDIENRQVAAYLHDILEDTKLNTDDLLFLGISPEQLDIVQRMTLPTLITRGGNRISDEEKLIAKRRYYQNISESLDALCVKCADRCSNLEDALKEVLETHEVRRWGRYVQETYDEVLPIFSSLPEFKREIVTRLMAIEKELPAALERRSLIVANERMGIK